MGRRGFQGRGVRLYLSAELYLGLIQLQADRKLGRSFAGLLSFTEGLYRMGFINKDVYERHKEKYSQPLALKKPKPLTKQELIEKREKEQLDKILGEVVKQWNIERPNIKKWRNEWLKIAKENPELSNSEKVLALGEFQ